MANNDCLTLGLPRSLEWFNSKVCTPSTYLEASRNRPCVVKLICKKNGLWFDVVPASMVQSGNCSHWAYLDTSDVKTEETLDGEGLE